MKKQARPSATSDHIDTILKNHKGNIGNATVVKLLNEAGFGVHNGRVAERRAALGFKPMPSGKAGHFKPVVLNDGAIVKVATKPPTKVNDPLIEMVRKLRSVGVQELHLVGNKLHIRQLVDRTVEVN